MAGMILALSVAGCDGCNKSKPYTPFTITDGPDAAASSGGSQIPPPGSDAGAAQGIDGGTSFQVIMGAAPEGDGKSWALDEGAVASAPVGRSFAVGLVLDADGDNKRDLIAWARAPDRLRGEIWFVPGSKPDAGRTIAALPSDLSVAGCSATATMSQVGPRLIVFDYQPRCDERTRDKAVRWIAALRLPGSDAAANARPEIGLELRLGAPAEGESFEVAVDPADRDGDGRSDLTATIRLAGAPRPLPAPSSPPGVTLAFFDRPTGLSRDPTEPEASLKALDAALVADARRKTSAPRIMADANELRRLFALVCEESGAARVSTSAGQISCGDVRIVEDTVMAEVEAAMNLSDPIAALAAVARLDAQGVRRKDIDAFISKRIPSVMAVRVHKTTLTPRVEPSPAFGPLAFDRNGDLLVRGDDHVARVDRASFSENSIDAPMQWPTQLAWPADAPKWKLIGVERRCDAPTLIAQFETPKGMIAAPLPVPVPPRCQPSSRVSAEMLGSSAPGTLVSIGADIIALPSEDPPRPARAESLSAASGVPIPLGSARSPDGSTVAIATTRGVFVAKPKGAGRSASGRLWTGLDTEGAHLCVPSDDAARLACVIQGAAAIFEAK